MSSFAYRAGALHAEGVKLESLAEAFGTPFYAYSATALRNNYRRFAAALAGLPATICFACKANDNLAILETLCREGAGADVVSKGELERALAAGMAPQRIVFSGVGKTRAEIDFALEKNILQINAESREELACLNEAARAAGRRVNVALRVNPNIDAGTHEKITTGRAENKFGIDLPHVREVYAYADSLDGIAVQGLAIHIGSQISTLEPFREAFECLAWMVRQLRLDGFTVARLDLGGGLGIAYREDETALSVADYAAVVRDVIAPLGCDLVFEPGRSLVADAGVLVSRIVRVKEGATRRFVILDAGMNDLIRPALYDAYHRILPLAAPAAGTPRVVADVVGPVCETADTFALARELPILKEGDLLAILDAGAYGAVMGSSYNSRARAAEILVEKDRHALIRKRQDTAELMALESRPQWRSL